MNTYTHHLDSSITALAENIYPEIFRKNYNYAGATLISLGQDISSKEFRAFMHNLKKELQQIHLTKEQKDLYYWTVARFDQQNTTKLHLDGGPPESYLLLGYEPSAIQANLYLLDYTKMGYDRQLSIEKLLDTQNPMFQKDLTSYKDYFKEIISFDNTQYQLLLINNCSLTTSPTSSLSLGLMHGATILHKDLTKQRVINSLMIYASDDVPNSIEQEEKISAFLDSSVVL